MEKSVETFIKTFGRLPKDAKIEAAAEIRAGCAPATPPADASSASAGAVNPVSNAIGARLISKINSKPAKTVVVMSAMA